MWAWVISARFCARLVAAYKIALEDRVWPGDVGYRGRGAVRSRILVVLLLLLAVLLAGCQEPIFESEQPLNPASGAAP